MFHEWVENTIFAEKTFADCSFVLPKDATPPNFTEKIFVDSHKTSKFAKVFCLKSFLLCGYQTSSDNVTKVKVDNFVSFQFNVMAYNPIGRPTPLYFQFPVNSESLTVTDDKLKVLDIPCEVSLRSNKM